MEKIYLNLLIICAFLSQGIVVLLEENINFSSGLLIRKKRLLDSRQHGNRPVLLQRIPYIVNIHDNGTSICAGSILTPKFIITAAHCVFAASARLVILSGSNLINEGREHRIIRKFIHPNYRPDWHSHELALLIIDPPINFTNSHNRPIELHQGTVATNMHGIFSGWGCNYVTEDEILRPRELRSITVPIISQLECQSFYEFTNITDKEICTFDRKKRKGGCFGDSGGPLAVNGSLAGIMAYSKSTKIPSFPDVFTNLWHPLYRNWILSHWN